MNKTEWQARGAGHRQRLREKFLNQGLSAFTEAEILELLLSLGTPRQDCKERARSALRQFGSLSMVLEASLEDLQAVPGIGPKNAFAVRFIHEVARHFLKQRLQGKTYVKAASDVVDYLSHALALSTREVFVAVFLDARNGILAVEDLFHGTLAASAVYPREVVRRALDHHAAALVFAHNHPSGEVAPSEADRRITRRLYWAARLLDIEVLDHIVIGQNGRYLSFADAGLMVDIRRPAGEIMDTGL